MPKTTKAIRLLSAAACAIAFVMVFGIETGHFANDAYTAVLFLLAASMSAQILLPIDRVV